MPEETKQNTGAITNVAETKAESKKGRKKRNDKAFHSEPNLNDE